LFLEGAMGMLYAALLYLTIDKDFGDLGCTVIMGFALVDINNKFSERHLSAHRLCPEIV
jgi:hypothetical protein